MKIMTRRAVIAAGAMSLLSLVGCSPDGIEPNRPGELMETDGPVTVDDLASSVFPEYADRASRNYYVDDGSKSAWSVVQPSASNTDAVRSSSLTLSDAAGDPNQAYCTAFGRRSLADATTSMSSSDVLDYCMDQIVESLPSFSDDTAGGENEQVIEINDVYSEYVNGIELSRSTGLVKITHLYDESLTLERRIAFASFIDEGYAIWIYDLDNTTSKSVSYDRLNDVVGRVVDSYRKETYEEFADKA